MSDYKNIQSLINDLNASAGKLENGKLSIEELEKMLNDARDLHERLAILQYSLGTKDKGPKAPAPKKEKPAPKENSSMNLNFSFNFDEPAVEENANTENEVIEDDPELKNQTNLLDAIEEMPEPQVEKTSETPKEEPKPESESIKSIHEIQSEQNTTSLNDKFAEQAEKMTLADKLGMKPISSLKDAIGLNQKFLFMNDLFEGENNLYNEAIKHLDSLSSFIEADEYLQSLKGRHKWETGGKSTAEFIELVQRRFS